MADLDFPASPIDGQTYNNYTYVASKSVWQSIPGIPAGLLAGTIMGWGGSTAPDQWLICDGSAVSRSTYSALYAAIGTTYGVGNGTTTFNLPDLRGRVPVGSGTAASGTGVTEKTLGTSGGNETNSHQHFTLTSNDGSSSYITQSGATVNGSTPASRVVTVPRYQLGGGNTSAITRQDATYDATVNLLAPYQVINYIIKYAAAYVPQESELVPRIDALESKVATSVRQVLSATRNTFFATTSSSYVDVTSVSISITPTSATSKILVHVSGFTGVNNASVAPSLQLVRNSSGIGLNSASTASGVPWVNNASTGSTFVYEYLDSPGTTSATTYKLQVASNGTATAYVGTYPANTSGSVSSITTITVFEVAA